jgi:hypothetical protein
MDQPWIVHWTLSDEQLSKIPAPVLRADIVTARLLLARRFNTRRLPKQAELELAWQQHTAKTR